MKSQIKNRKKNHKAQKIENHLQTRFFIRASNEFNFKDLIINLFNLQDDYKQLLFV